MNKYIKQNEFEVRVKKVVIFGGLEAAQKIKKQCFDDGSCLERITLTITAEYRAKGKTDSEEVVNIYDLFIKLEKGENLYLEVAEEKFEDENNSIVFDLVNDLRITDKNGMKGKSFELFSDKKYPSEKPFYLEAVKLAAK